MSDIGLTVLETLVLALLRALPAPMYLPAVRSTDESRRENPYIPRL